jgi:hypothetical protein
MSIIPMREGGEGGRERERMYRTTCACEVVRYIHRQHNEKEQKQKKTKKGQNQHFIKRKNGGLRKAFFVVLALISSIPALRDLS